MSTLNIDENNAAYQINGYNANMVKINGQVFTKSLVVGNEALIENWPVASTADLTSEALTPILELKPDILLIGTGDTHVLLPIELYASLLAKGLGIEVMSTPAACRTFNALTAENRQVAAALIIN